MSNIIKKCGNCANRNENVETVLKTSVYCDKWKKPVYKEDKTKKSCYRYEKEEKRN